MSHQTIRERGRELNHLVVTAWMIVTALDMLRLLLLLLLRLFMLLLLLLVVKLWWDVVRVRVRVLSHRSHRDMSRCAEFGAERRIDEIVLVTILMLHLLLFLLLHLVVDPLQFHHLRGRDSDDGIVVGVSPRRPVRDRMIPAAYARINLAGIHWCVGDTLPPTPNGTKGRRSSLFHRLIDEKMIESEEIVKRRTFHRRHRLLPV